MTIAFRAPGEYQQSSGALDRLGQYVIRFGSKAVLAGTEGSLKRYGGRILEQCRPGELEIRPVAVGKETTQTEIDRLADAFREARSEVMIGLGGGKALDTARAAADILGCPLILVPTVASNDAPCSALSVIHDESGSVLELRRTTRNPDLVLVDTAVLMDAPARLLIAGMGDALATWFEVNACRQAGAETLAGAPPSEIAVCLAQLCYDCLKKYAVGALHAYEAGIVNDDFERLVQATIFLSGVGFESGGVAGAHAINDGFSACPEASHLYHGEIVGFGTLAMLMLQNEAAEVVEEVTSFMKAVGLPMTFEQLNIIPDEALLLRVANVACTQSVMRNMPFPVTEHDVVRALLKADIVGRKALTEES
ncbi:MAG: glycerol dehydrogenase [Oscillospiraceae bacterium]|nr:glycerol dehydrogenase [Oscillospiraceae bacterium]